MLHSQILPKDNHPIYTWSYSTEAARLADTSFVVSDIGKLAWEVDNNTFWVLLSVTPISWAAINTTAAPATSLNIPASGVARDLTGNFSANSISAHLIGNADTASTLLTARTIFITGEVNGSAVFDGSSDIQITTTATPGAVTLGVDTSGSYVAVGSVTGNGLSGSAAGATSTFTVNSNATQNNVPSTIVFRDSSGNFSAGVITATEFIGPITGTITGNAASSSKWSTGRTINVTGSNIGSVSLDGSADVTLTLTQSPNAVELGTNTSGNYVATGSVAGLGLSGSSSAPGGTFTVTSNATVISTPNALVCRDNNGNFSANIITATEFRGPITGTITGVASSANVLSTARNIAVSGAVVGSVAFDGSADVTIATTLQNGTVTLGTTTVGDYVATLFQGTGVTISNATGAGSTPTIQIGQPIGTNDSPTFADLTIKGNLTVQGATTTINTTNMSVSDAIVTLASGNTTASVPVIGLLAERGAIGAYWIWDEVNQSWRAALSHDGIAFASTSIMASSFIGSVTGAASLNVLKSGDTMSGDLTIAGALSATTKNFLIAHPTKPDMQLRHGSLEGPENGVYVRGKTKSSVIELPEYWTKLIDPDTITVGLTAIGKTQNLLVAGVWNNKVYIINEDGDGSIDCYYHVFAERVDVAKMQVEISNNKEM